MNKLRRVFILAHCDDELFCLPLLLDENSENTLIFLTTKKRNGDAITNETNVRKSEALAANKFLSNLQSIQTLFFDGKVFDGFIHADFQKSEYDQLVEMVLEQAPDELITLSFEGGHQDHDSTEIITRTLSRDLNMKMRCFSGYRASSFSTKFFLLLKPITPLRKIKFNRFKAITTSLRLMYIYRSQTKTWIGLAPVLLFKYAFFSFWEASRESTMEPKQISNCFYENRGRAYQHDVLNDLLNLTRNIGPDR